MIPVVRRTESKKSRTYKNNEVHAKGQKHRATTMPSNIKAFEPLQFTVSLANALVPHSKFQSHEENGMNFRSPSSLTASLTHALRLSSGFFRDPEDEREFRGWRSK